MFVHLILLDISLYHRIAIQDQVQDVLDAMFEKTVDSGDYVIRQGDDGDNFYVIDRYNNNDIKLSEKSRFNSLSLSACLMLCPTVVRFTFTSHPIRSQPRDS